MIVKKFILNADDFGLTKYNNQAILEGYVNGFLRSTSLCANTEGFENAVNDILPDCPELSIGVHLNIIEGKSLTNCSLITNKKGEFNKGYFYFVLNQNNKELLTQIENEFRAQIEKIIKYTKPDHIDSHVHTHAIPEIFKIVCKLAEEYEIPYVRTQYEQLYIIPKIQYINIKFAINLLKIALLNYFTNINRETLKNYNLKTNNNIIGVGYTGMMDIQTIISGLEEIDESYITEALIHPCKYPTNKKNSHTKEFFITQDKKIQDEITRMGFELTSYKNLG